MKKKTINKLANEIDISFLKMGLPHEFLTPKQYYKIRFTIASWGENGKNREFNLIYKTLAEAEKAAKSICKGEAYKDVRIVYILEYATEVKRIK